MVSRDKRLGFPNEKHHQPLPNVRQIRRSCNRELYRTIKRLGQYIPPDKIEQAEQLYVRKVLGNLLWIAENGSNRRRLADWWEEQVCPEVAKLWQVEETKLADAFRRAFGG